MLDNLSGNKVNAQRSTVLAPDSRVDEQFYKLCRILDRDICNLTGRMRTYLPHLQYLEGRTDIVARMISRLYKIASNLGFLV